MIQLHLNIYVLCNGTKNLLMLYFVFNLIVVSLDTIILLSILTYIIDVMVI